MKKFKTHIMIFLGVLLFLGYHSALLQDRSSKEYYSWLKVHQDEIVRSQKKQKILLEKDFKFNGLEIIIVSEGEKYYSWWGHILLRLVGSGNDNPDEDLVISFLADFNDFPLNKLKAGLGGYEVMVKTDTLAQYKKEYMEKEHRTMSYSTLISTAEQNSRLLSTIRTWILNPKTPGLYSFFFKNCVGLMNHLLYEARILKQTGFYGYFPKYVISSYKNSGIIK
ncbi:MAG: DUF4105 domain-containing protein [Bacteriovorax sp.]|jgi:hypothetical protein